MLIAYDAAGNVVGTLDFLVVPTDGGVGMVDFAAHEADGGKLREIFEVAGAVGSATWPEEIGARAHEFRVELNGKRIGALVHKDSGERRARPDRPGRPDIGPDGRDRPKGPPSSLPLVSAGRQREG